jgi:outer membrane protein OmpA-like peptidoglycan-associated protein
MKPLLPVLAGLLAIGALTYFCANHHRPHFEADLTSRTQSALTAIPIPKAEISAEGQIVTLRGEVTSEELKMQAGADAAKVWGVEEVRNLMTVASVPNLKVLTAEEKVTAVSCQAEFTKLLASDQIRFVTGEAVINPISYPLLNNLAAASGKCPVVSFEVGGHTDSDGPLDMNMALSKNRADAVVDYLAKQGVPADRMSAVGYGPNQPIVDNKTPQGKQQNRRTEFKVKGI